VATREPQVKRRRTWAENWVRSTLVSPLRLAAVVRRSGLKRELRRVASSLEVSWRKARRTRVAASGRQKRAPRAETARRSSAVRLSRVLVR
jgi:hypothetical protein